LPDFEYLHKTEPHCDGKKFRSLAVLVQAGFTVNIRWSKKSIIPPQIQGVSRLVDIIAGSDFPGICDQKKFI